MSGFAWVTLATNDSYSLGALVLAHSLRQTGTAHQLAVLVTPGVTNAMRKNLADAFNVVEEVNLFDSKDEANLRLLKRPELGVTFTKLHCWRLTQFEKCVFLDADVLVLVNSDELFERDEFSAAPDVGWPDCFNSGVFVYKPSLETYTKLVDFALQTGSFDGGDQGLLNAYFSDWAHKDISKHLPFIYNMCSTASYSYLPAFKYYGANVKIVHFIGPAKPWLQYFDTESRKVHPSPDLQHLQDVLQKWWDIFCSLIHPKLSPDMSGLAGAFAQFTLGVKRSPSQDALENHLRRQAWEVGNIDYMGRDSFDNIWNKICQTLSSTELEAGPVKVEAVSSSASQQVPEVAKDSQETVATIAETPVTPEQSQGNVIQAEANLQVADVPTPPADISLQPISSEASKTEEEVGAPPASSEVSQQQSEVAPQPQPEAIPISEIPPQSQPEEAPLQTVPVQLESKAPLAPPQETPLQEVPQPQLEVAPIVQPEPIFVQEASQSQLETAPLAPPEVAPLQEVSQPQSEVAPIVQQEPTVVQETSQPQLETAPLAPPEAVPLEELPQPQPETTPLEATPELQPEIPIPLQEIQQTQSEIPAPVQETPQTVQEVLPTQPEIAPVQEISTVQPDVIPKTEVAPPKEESKAEIPVVQEEPTKPIEAIQQIETPQPTQLPITETPAVVEEVKVQQVENKPQEEVIVAPIQESIPPPEIPVEKPVETPILKEEPAPIKEEIPAATVKSTETKKVTQPEKVEETKKEPVAIPKKGATKSEAAKAAKEPESPKAEASVVQESAPGEASTDVPKSDTKPKETRKIKKKVKKVPKAEASGEGPEGTSKK